MGFVEGAEGGEVGIWVIVLWEEVGVLRGFLFYWAQLESTFRWFSGSWGPHAAGGLAAAMLGSHFLESGIEIRGFGEFQADLCGAPLAVFAGEDEGAVERVVGGARC